jgi:thioredoxin 1
MHSVLEVNADNWEKEILQSNTLVVVDFWHERCPWCVRLDPIFSKVSEEYGNMVKFAKINVLANGENQNIAAKYGIMGTPTLVFFCFGRPVKTVTGFQPIERLKQLINDVISRHQECIEQRQS